MSATYPRTVQVRLVSDVNRSRSWVGHILAALFLALPGVALLTIGTAPDPLAPYGGCDEAWQAPTSAGAAWCEAHGEVRP